MGKIKEKYSLPELRVFPDCSEEMGYNMVSHQQQNDIKQKRARIGYKKNMDAISSKKNKKNYLEGGFIQSYASGYSFGSLIEKNLRKSTV